MTEEPYILVKAEITGEGEIEAYEKESNMTPENTLYREFSKHAIEFITHLAQNSRKGLELKLTLKD